MRMHIYDLGQLRAGSISVPSRHHLATDALIYSQAASVSPQEPCKPPKTHQGDPARSLPGIRALWGLVLVPRSCGGGWGKPRLRRVPRGARGHAFRITAEQHESEAYDMSVIVCKDIFTI